MVGSTTTTCCLAAFAAVTVGEDRTVVEMQAPAGPSPGQTCVLILIFTVLLQSLCVAVTYMYFTSELRQVSTMHTVPDRGSRQTWLTASVSSSVKTLQ